MKLLGLPTLILCIHLSQICSSREHSDEDINREVKSIQNTIYGVSEQFLDDVKVILEEYRNNSMIFGKITFGLVSGNALSNNRAEIMGTDTKKNAKIDVKAMKEYYSTDSYLSSVSALRIAIDIDKLKIYQSILSKQLPPERFNGVMNLFYVNSYPNATTEEIESALGYLYGTDTAASKTSFLDKFPDLKATDCLYEDKTFLLSEAENTLKSMIDVKPKVIEDFKAIRHKFPCNYDFVLVYLRAFVDLLKRSQGDDSKVDACKIKAKPGNWENYWGSWDNTRERMEPKIYEIESIFSTRLTDETYRGLINFLRVTIPGTPIGEIEKALEYLYDDVPEAKCPEKEAPKSETE